ncbi:copper chaperone PCu(A)C [Microbacterium sp. NPDC056052]|uniref:copper chaperone PCu(A)C n=1 Tax=Microbacterium sp. NPDC056052 TaxID=3345695 RepID=UPI0035DDA3CD
MNTTTNTATRLARLTVLAAVSLLALTGCAASAAPAPATSAPAGDVVTIENAWVKSAADGMSATFGTLANSSGDDVTVVSVASDASNMLQLHETVANDSGEMVMREIEGGFVIPARGELALEPGANHIMLMDLTAPLKAGAEASFTLTFSDRSTYTFTAPVKDYSGANENYDDGHKGAGH